MVNTYTLAVKILLRPWLLLSFLLACSPAHANELDLAQLASGEFYSSLLAAGLLLPLAQEEGFSGTLRGGDALVTTYLATVGIKALGISDRPGDGPGAGKSDSFPSGHASTSFAIATVQAELHPDQAVYWYGAATLVSASRIKLKRHHIQDVVAGAALGYGIAQLELNSEDGLLISPFVEPEGDGVGVNLSWDL
jgi:membrane-associated phospholipid phosphatase